MKIKRTIRRNLMDWSTMYGSQKQDFCVYNEKIESWCCQAKGESILWIF